MYIITHRGLDAESHHQFTESSKEAFAHFLNDGFGIEFDIRITSDDVAVISHDESLSRLTHDAVSAIAHNTVDTFLQTPLQNGSPVTLEELIALMSEAPTGKHTFHALHLKHHNQTPDELEKILPYLAQLTALPILIFDATPASAQIIKEQVPELLLAASVAHPYDIERYGGAVGDTLVSVSDMEKYTDRYDWVWLDEWDRTDIHNREKALYTEETFASLHALGYKIAVVSPELHHTSPKLLGGEAHPDATNDESLEKRWGEIITLQPDAICTDYPYRLKKLAS